MFDNVILAKKIKSFRLAKGLTQKELAEKLYNNGEWLTLEDYLGITSQYR